MISNYFTLVGKTIDFRKYGLSINTQRSLITPKLFSADKGVPLLKLKVTGTWGIK